MCLIFLSVYFLLVPWRRRWTIMAYSFPHFITFRTFTRERGLLLGLSLVDYTTWMKSSSLLFLMLLSFLKSPFFNDIITLVIYQSVPCTVFYLFILLLPKTISSTPQLSPSAVDLDLPFLLGKIILYFISYSTYGILFPFGHRMSQICYNFISYYCPRTYQEALTIP